MNQRIFLAHGKGDDADELQLKLYVKLSGQPYEITTGKDDYEARFQACGTWDAWTESVARGRYMGAPRYHAFIVPWGTAKSIGKATMQIITAALIAGKRCYAWDVSTNTFQKIVSVEAIDPNNWRSGWTLGLGPLDVST